MVGLEKEVKQLMFVLCSQHKGFYGIQERVAMG